MGSELQEEPLKCPAAAALGKTCLNTHRKALSFFGANEKWHNNSIKFGQTCVSTAFSRDAVSSNALLTNVY